MGKEGLTLEQYITLCLTTVEEGMEFAHLITVLAWNLEARVGNVVYMLTDHIGVLGDHLLLYFAHMKGDQTGKRTAIPRGVYANPLKPEICSYLALGLYYLVYPDGLNNLELFEGEYQYERYIKVCMYNTMCVINDIVYCY